MIRYLRGDSRALALLDHLAKRGNLETSAVVVLETFRGCRLEREERAAEEAFGFLRIIDADYALAVAAARLLREHRGVFSSDRAILDAVIASSAIAEAATLVTLNIRPFSRLRVPGLNLLLLDQDADDWVAFLS